MNEALPIEAWSPEIELLRFRGGGLEELPTGSDALSEFRREYYEMFSARLDLEIDRANP